MEVVVERCAGLDVGKDEVVGCVRTPARSGRGRRSELRTFLTFTSGLEELADWLTANGVVMEAMEATGQYWKPIWYLLEDRGFELQLVNAKHVKMVPGRKTDLADAAWLAELLEHGLLRSSFVPPAAIRELRDLTRYRKRLIQAHTAEGQRIAKILEDAGIKLDSVASDVLGVDQLQLIGPIFQHVPDRLPVGTGGLHRDVGDALFGEPVGHLLQRAGERGERPGLLATTAASERRSAHAGHHLVLTDVDPRAPFDQHVHLRPPPRSLR